MKNIKRLSLAFIMLITSFSFALAQESEVVMTKEELTSFLEKVAEARRIQLRSESVTQIKGNSYMKNVKNKKDNNRDGNRVMQQLDRINDRIDNLFMLHAGGSRLTDRKSTVVVSSDKDATIEELQKQLDALKADNNNVKEEFVSLEQRIANAKTQEERRDALKDLLAKFKNFKKQVFFAHNSDQLTSEDYNYLKDVTEVLNKYPELSVVLEGWASPVGNANYNKQLSMRRSESVEKALKDNGISDKRIVSSFKGEDHSTSDAMARRVDMSVILK